MQILHDHRVKISRDVSTDTHTREIIKWRREASNQGFKPPSEGLAQVWD